MPLVFLTQLSPMVKLPITLACVLWLQCAFIATSFAITVKDTKGRTMEIEVMSYTKSSGNVRIKRKDGNLFNVKISLFDEVSQKQIIATAPPAYPKLDISISAGKRRQKVAGSSYMKSNLVSISTKIKNPSQDIDLPKCKFTIILIGRNSKRYADRKMDWSKILSVQKFESGLQASKELSHELQPITTKYDSDKDSSNAGGWEYDGYLLIIQKPDGEILEGKSSIGPLKTTVVNQPELLKKALNVSENTELNRDFTPLKGLAPQ